MPKMNRSTKASGRQYASLEPRIKPLKEATIRKRWKKLPVRTQVKVADLLRAIERPILTDGRSERNNGQAQAVVSELVEELVQRLPRMPFPPGTDEISFDFESTINRQRVLEEQLTTNTHTLGLLSGEVDAETEFLEQEKAELHALEMDVAALDEKDRNHKRRLHPLAEDVGPEKSRILPAEYELHSAIKTPASVQFHFEADPEADDILKQLRHQLDSMQDDIGGPTDIATALSASQAAFGVFNWRHLREAEYHQVYEVNAT